MVEIVILLSHKHSYVVEHVNFVCSSYLTLFHLELCHRGFLIPKIAKAWIGATK